MASHEQKVLRPSTEDSGSVIHIEELDDSVRASRYVVDQTGSVKAYHNASDGASSRSLSIKERMLQAWQYLLGVFLPAGYPHSVTEDYINYQIYDSLQAFCSSIAGLLSSRAVLSSVGVGDSTASPTSALLLSVLQESTGRVATILFAHRLGTSLEPECKAYRLAADFFNDAAMVLDCLSPAFPRQVRVVVLSCSSMLRSLCGVAAGSAKASLSAHFAKRGNLGEVNAKDSSQETVISLVGMLAGTLVVSAVTSTWATWTALLLLLSLHLTMNYMAVRAVNMNTLNRQRACIVFSHLLGVGRGSGGDQATSTATSTSTSSLKPARALAPNEVSRHERIFGMDGKLTWFEFSGPGTLSQPVPRRTGFVEMAVPFSRLVSAIKRSSGCDAASASSVAQVLSVFRNEQFALWAGSDGHTSVVLKDGATPRDVLKAWVLALRWSHDSKVTGKRDAKALGRVLDSLSEDWDGYVALLEKAGWDLEIGSIETGKARRVRVRKEE